MTESQVVSGTVLGQPSAAETRQAIDLSRPLDKEQKQNLLDILQDDVQVAMQELGEVYNTTARRLKEEAIDRRPNKVTLKEQYGEDLRKLMRKFDKGLAELQDKAKEDGFGIDFGRNFFRANYGSDVRRRIYDLEEYDSEYRAAKKRLDDAYREAKRHIENQQHAAKRNVRIASVNVQAEKILGGMPSTGDMLSKLAEAAAGAPKAVEGAKTDE